MDRYSSILIFIPFSLNEINKEEKHVYVCTLLLQKSPPPQFITSAEPMGRST